MTDLDRNQKLEILFRFLKSIEEIHKNNLCLFSFRPCDVIIDSNGNPKIVSFMLRSSPYDTTFDPINQRSIYFSPEHYSETENFDEENYFESVL
jgi:hypothetical protein